MILFIFQLTSVSIIIGQMELCLQTDKTVYIFDEPTNFIDESRKTEVFSMIEELEKRESW